MGLFVSKVQGQDNAWRCPPCQKIYSGRAEAYACCPDRKPKPSIERNCKVCHNSFPVSWRNRKYCSDKCREKLRPRKKEYEKKRGKIPDVTKDIRLHFARIKDADPILAERLAKEMQSAEGKEFKDMVLGGI